MSSSVCAFFGQRRRRRLPLPLPQKRSTKRRESSCSLSSLFCSFVVVRRSSEPKGKKIKWHKASNKWKAVGESSRRRKIALPIQILDFSFPWLSFSFRASFNRPALTAPRAFQHHFLFFLYIFVVLSAFLPSSSSSTWTSSSSLTLTKKIMKKFKKE